MKKVFLIWICMLAAAAVFLCACGRESTPVEGVDIDLPALSATVRYSEVYRMMSVPEEYMGKTVRARGKFALYRNASDGTVYFACLIVDATACCSQGLEFVLRGDATYPDDYPPVGTEITVTGTFGTYEDSGYRYVRLSDAVMTVCKN